MRIMDGARDIHVLHVVPTLGVGGLELAMSRVIRSLRGRGSRHSVICLKGRCASELAEALGEDVPIYYMNARPHDLSLPLRLLKVLRQARPTVIHARNWSAWPDIAVARLLLRGRPPLVFSFHGLQTSGTMPVRRRLACSALARVTTRIFSVCDRTRELLAAQVGLSPARVEVIPNGVDTNVFSPRLATEARSPGRLVIGSVGSLTPVKNHAMLLRSCADLLARGIDLEVRIAGEGPLRQELEHLALSLRLGERFKLMGNVRYVPAFLQELDMFVLPSASEAHPNALLEAMSCGLACVACDVGGVSEVVLGAVQAGCDGNGGWTAGAGVVVRPADQASLSNAMAMLAGDGGLRQQLGLRAREVICRDYSMERMLDAYERLYRHPDPHDRQRRVVSHSGAPAPVGMDKPLVFMLGPRPPLVGGMVSVIDNLCGSSLRDRFDVYAFQTGKTTPVGRPLLAGLGAQWALFWRLDHELSRQRPRVVHIHTCSGSTFWRDSLHMLIARLYGAEGMWHIHGGGFGRFIHSLGPVGRRLMSRALRLAKAVIVLNEEMLEHRALAPKALWQVVVNGVNVCAGPDGAGGRGQRGKATTFIFMGNLNPGKGAWDLIEAAGQAVARKCDLLVRIAGPSTSPAQKEQLERLVGDCGCADHVELLGVLGGSEKANALAQADVLVLPSHCEAMPMAILEGMAAGLPIIATSVGAIPQIVREGVEGFLVPAHDIASLSGRMSQMADDAGLRRRMGEAARKRVAGQYSVEAMVQPIERMYMQILNSGAPG